MQKKKHTHSPTLNDRPALNYITFFPILYSTEISISRFIVIQESIANFSLSWIEDSFWYDIVLFYFHEIFPEIWFFNLNWMISDNKITFFFVFEAFPPAFRFSSYFLGFRTKIKLKCFDEKKILVFPSFVILIWVFFRWKDENLIFFSDDEPCCESFQIQNASGKKRLVIKKYFYFLRKFNDAGCIQGLRDINTNIDDN